MILINYLLPILIAFASLFAGVFLAYSTKEELKPGRKYFILLGEILLFAIIIVTLLQLHTNFSLIFAILLLLSVILLLTKIKDLAVPVLFGVATYFSYNTKMFFLILSLIFISGLVSGTLFASKNIKKPMLRNVKLSLIPYSTFLVTSYVLFLAFQLA